MNSLRLFARYGSRLGAVTVVALLSACRTSPPPDRFEPARNPRGVAGSVRLTTGSYLNGELLAVSDSAFVMLINSRVMIAPYDVVAIASFDRIGEVSRREARGPSVERERLRYASRFPYGITAQAMEALLAHSGQRAPHNARDPLPPNTP